MPYSPNIDPSRPIRKKRGAVFTVIVVSIAAHLLAGGVLAVIKITEVLQREAEFEAPPLEAIKPPPPPPPPPPTTQRTQKSMPRPQPLAAQNPLNMEVPTIEIDRTNLNMLSGRGFGGGLGQIGGGVLDTANFNLTAFGFDGQVEGTLEGILFDFKKDKNGNPIDRSEAGWTNAWNLFKGSFDRKKLERKYYSAKKKLYGSYFVIPHQSANIAPEAFGAADEITSTHIGAFYSGKFTPSQSGTYRFYGRADDVIIVRINGKIVLDGSHPAHTGKFTDWRMSDDAKQLNSERPKNKFFSSQADGILGDKFQLQAGVPVDMDLVIAEVPGGWFCAYLLIEKVGSSKGLQIFSTIPLTAKDRDFLKDTHKDATDLP